MATNWPPAGAPSWPPPGYSWVEATTLADLEDALPGMTNAAPTAAETNSFFKNARCDDGHAVVGRMLIFQGVRYPFAVCNNSAHRQFLVLWPPFVWGQS